MATARDVSADYEQVNNTINEGISAEKEINVISHETITTYNSAPANREQDCSITEVIVLLNKNQISSSFQGNTGDLDKAQYTIIGKDFFFFSEGQVFKSLKFNLMFGVFKPS